MDKQQRLAEMRRTDAFLAQVKAGTYVTAEESARRAVERNERFLLQQGAQIPPKVRQMIERNIADARRIAAGQQISLRYETARVR